MTTKMRNEMAAEMVMEIINTFNRNAKELSRYFECEDSFYYFIESITYSLMDGGKNYAAMNAIIKITDMLKRDDISDSIYDVFNYIRNVYDNDYVLSDRMERINNQDTLKQNIKSLLMEYSIANDDTFERFYDAFSKFTGIAAASHEEQFKSVLNTIELADDCLLSDTYNLLIYVQDEILPWE